MSFLQIALWACLGAVAYNYLGYPIVLFLMSILSQAKSDLAYLLQRGSRRCGAGTHRPTQTDQVPRVAILISAYNEQSVIAAKIINSLDLDYPAKQLEILVGLDAPTDATPELLTNVLAEPVRVFHFRTRRGKLAVISDLSQRTTADILVLTDANTILDHNCLRNLVRHFADPKVGAVTGEEVRTATNASSSAESLYWRYESALKFLESRLNCSLGANGGILAVRRTLFRPSRQSIVEDLQIPLDIRMKGYRVVYDPEVVATEETAPTLSAQFVRRVRIGAGDYQTLFHNPAYLNPLNGLLAFCFISHKALRWLAPVFLVLAFLFNLFLAGRPDFAILLALQCVFYSTAAIGYWLKRSLRPMGLCAVPFHFCAMNFSLLLGFFAYATGKQTLVWRSTPRTDATSIVATTISIDGPASAQIMDTRAA